MDSGAANIQPYTNPSSGDAVGSYQGGFGPDLHKGEMVPGNVHSTVVVIQEDTSPVRDDLFWSLFNTIYLNMCCLGLVALWYSIQSRDRKHSRDIIGARLQGTTARRFNMAATTVSITVFIIMIIVYVSRI
ncbi:hypothetical protein GDO81_016435 [Engystomops pustulosus]|uniref:Interferon-induced transmembrane protein 3 n=1 Tax=Engystomops pustulosus TaxID=76066 RepID=A0AAV7AS32_ENGPU|nr:hypothetical protein GDO81_016435 [Engystomops pustulosus]